MRANLYSLPTHRRLDAVNSHTPTHHYLARTGLDEHLIPIHINTCSAHEGHIGALQSHLMAGAVHAEEVDEAVVHTPAQAESGWQVELSEVTPYMSAT